MNPNQPPRSPEDDPPGGDLAMLVKALLTLPCAEDEPDDCFIGSTDAPPNDISADLECMRVADVRTA